MATVTPKIAIDVCERLITAATSHCPAALQTVTPLVHPQIQVQHGLHWNAVEAGLTSLSTAFTYGTIMLALVAVIAGAGWAYLVRGWAKDEAGRIAKETMDEWLTNEAPRILRDGQSFLKPDGEDPNTPSAEQDADDIGKAAG